MKYSLGQTEFMVIFILLTNYILWLSQNNSVPTNTVSNLYFKGMCGRSHGGGLTVSKVK